jgi:hypothetical protein
MKGFVALCCGVLFGVGLAASGMTDPAKVQGFLDIFGVWDPSLAFVMGGAVVVTVISFRFVLPMAKPLLADSFDLPSRKDIDTSLLLGAALFGVGWGLTGLCPGPAIASLAYLNPNILIFLCSMVIGGYGGQLLASRL